MNMKVLQKHKAVVRAQGTPSAMKMGFETVAVSWVTYYIFESIHKAGRSLRDYSRLILF